MIDLSFKIFLCCSVESGLEGQEWKQRYSSEVVDRIQFRKGGVLAYYSGRRDVGKRFESRYFEGIESKRLG